jgi:choline dehydrogenase-like flavoprotein
VVVGAGYAGLHVALRLTSRLRDHPGLEAGPDQVPVRLLGLKQ